MLFNGKKKKKEEMTDLNLNFNTIERQLVSKVPAPYNGDSSKDKSLGRMSKRYAVL